MDIKKFLLSALILLSLQADAFATTLLQYSWTTDKNPTTTAGGVSGSIAANGSLTFFTAPSTQGYSSDPVAFCTPASGATSATSAVTNNSYYQFTLTPDANKSVDLTSLTFKGARGGSSTPRGYVVRSSADDYATTIQTANFTTQRTTFTTYTVDLSAALYQSLTSAITFRIYSYTPAVSSSVEYDDVTLNGTINTTGGVSLDTFVDVPNTSIRYVAVTRDSVTTYANIYSDPNRTNLLKQLQITESGTNHRYAYHGLANNIGVSGTSFSFSVANSTVTQETPPATPPAQGCSAQTTNNCILPTVASGTSSGVCSNIPGSCSYSCTNGVWSLVSNTCSTPAVGSGTGASSGSGASAGGGLH